MLQVVCLKPMRSFSLTERLFLFTSFSPKKGVFLTKKGRKKGIPF
jgi:hypothetical protein